jgi:molecular chaperone HscB
VNFFEVFDLPRKLGIDAAELQRRFHALSRRHHPDFHQSAPAEEQARVLESSARVNAAYRVLRDPIARVEYLIRLEEGRDAKEGDETVDGHGPSRPMVKPKAPPELLEEMFEIEETLHDARTGGLDDTARATVAAQRERLAARRAAEDLRITGELSVAWDAAAAGDKAKVLAGFKAALATRAYLRTVIDDLGEALGSAGEGHVAHHRH